MNTNRPLISCSLLGLLAVLLSGCGRATSIERAEVVGFVTLDGQPVEQAMVHFSPRSSTKAGSLSGTVADGMFEFLSDKGPAPGAYDVLLTPVEQDSEEVLAQVLERKEKPLAERNRFLEAVARKGPLVVEVSKDSMNEMMIELTSR